MEYFLIVLEQICIFVIYALIGVIAVKSKVLDKKGLDVLSRYITKIGLPFLIFTNTINGADRQEFLDTLPVLLATVGKYLFLYVLCMGLARIFKLTGNERNVYHACAMFGNIGFMGIPVVSALFPEKGMLYIALFTVIDQLILWTVGLNLTSPVESSDSLTGIYMLKKMVNPATVGIVLAVIGILFNVHLPELVNTALTKTGATATPLAMIYLGGVFCYTDIGMYIKKVEFYGMVVVKMCIAPIILFYVMRLIPGISMEIAVTMGALCAMPTMSSIAMLAQSQHSAGEYSAGMIFVTTLCSIVTLPMVCLLIG